VAKFRLWRWVGLTAASLGLLAVAAVAFVLIVSEFQLREHSAERAEAISVPNDPASIAEGGRLVMVHGCISCHGANVGGNLLFDAPVIARIVAPDLTVSVATQTTADLVTAIRRGVRSNGRTMMVMPSQAFAPLTDADLGKILAYVKSLPRTEGLGPSVTIGPVGRLGLVTGQFKTSLRFVTEAKPPPVAQDATSEFGRYLARTSCAQCHAADLRGAEHPEGFAPDLRVVAAYSPQDFDRLMHTGIGLGNRKLGVMTGWAAMNFSSFSETEVASLYRYLHAMAD
jgi:mono/diheme cytochrome c family protein